MGDNSRLTNRARLQAFWDATAKIRANLDLRYAHRDIVSSINAAESGTDSTRRIALGLRYRPNRAWEVGCSVGHESRSASTTLSYDYSAAVAGCSVQLTLQ